MDTTRDEILTGPWHCHFAGSVAEQADGEYGDAIGITTASAVDFEATGDRGHLVAWVPCDRHHDDIAAVVAAAPETLAMLRRIVAAQHRFFEANEKGTQLEFQRAADEFHEAIDDAADFVCLLPKAGGAR